MNPGEAANALTMRVAALSGRRIDAEDAPVARFPLANAGLVRNAISSELETLGVRVLVCSAACGADLLALSAAGDLGIRRRAVLPVPPARFRETSVTDRPGDWGPLFDRVVADLTASNDLVTLASPLATGTELYLDTNRRMLDEAQALARPTGTEAVAIVVWEGRSRGRGDVTDAFREDARRRGLQVIEIATVRTSG